MKISIKFKHLPANGKFIKGDKHYILYNSEGNFYHPNNKQRTYRLPKFIWRLI